MRHASPPSLIGIGLSLTLTLCTLEAHADAVVRATENPCVAGSRYVIDHAGTCVLDDCDEDHPCPGGQRCARRRLCTETQRRGGGWSRDDDYATFVYGRGDRGGRCQSGQCSLERVCLPALRRPAALTQPEAREVQPSAPPPEAAAPLEQNPGLAARVQSQTPPPVRAAEPPRAPATDAGCAAAGTSVRSIPSVYLLILMLTTRRRSR